MTRPFRFALMVPGMLALLAAAWAGLARLGVFPPVHGTLSGTHGALMVSGFFGTLIGLERAVALGRPWAYAAPALTALGGLAWVLGLPHRAGLVLVTLGSAVMLAGLGAVIRRQSALFTWVMALAGAVLLLGNVIWLMGRPTAVAVPWWAGFLVLTIAAERLELNRLLEPSPAARGAFMASIGLTLAGLVLTVWQYSPGVRLTGAGFGALALWLLVNDIARRTVRQAGLTRYIAICLLTGYVWLGVAGVLALGYGGAASAGLIYDAWLHALFLGFIMSMVFGHAPVIFPAVLGIPVPFRLKLYGPLALLHLSLLLRVAGDLAKAMPLRQWGGSLNVIAVLFFLGLIARSAIKEAARGRLSGGQAVSGPRG